MAYARIADYALIGDCHSAALVRLDGSIDWACVRRFDGEPAFCRLLDDARGGSFQLGAQELQAVTRRYLPDTNVLETTFETATGRARVLDCFTMRKGGKNDPHRQLVRVLEGERGTVRFDLLCQPRFDYGALHPWLRHHPPERVYSAVGGDAAFVLSADVPLTIDDDACALRGEVRLDAGQRVRISLISTLPHELYPIAMPPAEIDQRLEQTLAWWRAWVARGHYTEEYRDAVVRSALVLKLLTCAPTGAVIAAPTTSLPEAIGRERNWDYRYSWIRDATLTLGALIDVGHAEVAHGFKKFIERSTAGNARELQIMYGAYGTRRLSEVTLDHLDGYRGSKPVRIGNGAYDQVQLDVWGDLLDAAHLWRLSGHPMSADEWHFLRGLVDAAVAAWRTPDRGLWESRGAPQHYVYSKVMCWVAADRGIRAAEACGLECDLAGWKREREAIRASVESEGIDRARNCFVQSYGSTELDASLLRLPMVGFIDARDPRMLATVRAIEADLTTDGLVRRYRPARSDDGLAGDEGTFLMASFWLVDVLTMQGELDEAERRMRRLLALGNDVGLFSEEYSATEGELLGNFPQAFTHIALIHAAEQLHRARAGGSRQQVVSERSAESHP